MIREFLFKVLVQMYNRKLIFYLKLNKISNKNINNEVTKKILKSIN